MNIIFYTFCEINLLSNEVEFHIQNYFVFQRKNIVLRSRNIRARNTLPTLRTLNLDSPRSSIQLKSNRKRRPDGRTDGQCNAARTLQLALNLRKRIDALRKTASSKRYTPEVFPRCSGVYVTPTPAQFNPRTLPGIRKHSPTRRPYRAYKYLRTRSYVCTYI